MKAMQVPIRAIGNSRGIVIPKPLLIQAGLETAVDLTVEGGVIVLRKPAAHIRAGWAEAAQVIAEQGEDALVMGEFANSDDTELTW
jgi:antitoxin MazE